MSGLSWATEEPLSDVETESLGAGGHPRLAGPVLWLSDTGHMTPGADYRCDGVVVKDERPRLVGA